MAYIPRSQMDPLQAEIARLNERLRKRKTRGYSGANHNPLAETSIKNLLSMIDMFCNNDRIEALNKAASNLKEIANKLKMVKAIIAENEKSHDL